jgi:DNA-binding winged helix-turn-helix (wHTH) protein
MIYRFGRAVLDYRARQLLVEGQEVHLSPKALELLALLIANRSRAVPKRELLDKLWPDSFVEETNLAGLAAEIRRAVGDSAHRPAVLRTVHGFGYRFVADVVEADLRAAARACLVFENRTLLLLEGSSVIGRAPDATIRCDVTGVSRYHARVTVSGPEVLLEDLGSKNGTYVQGERIAAAARLSDGDDIRLGTARLTFRLEPPAGATETVPTSELR